MSYYTFLNSPVGRLTLASDGKLLTGLWFDEQKNYPNLEVMKELDLPVFKQANEWLEIYFSGRKPKPFNLLNPKGSEFVKRIWQGLPDIPYGETTTYGEVAERYYRHYHKATSARAIGVAVGKNPISIIIPCHRVIGKNNKLTGYAGGLKRKKQLLKLEKNSK